MLESIQTKRWFIWTIVFLVVAGVGLVSYINYVSATADENSSPISWLTHHPKVVQKTVQGK